MPDALRARESENLDSGMPDQDEQSRQQDPDTAGATASGDCRILLLLAGVSALEIALIISWIRR